MTLTKKNKPNKKPAGFDLMPIVIAIGVIGFILTIYIGYRASISDRNLFSVSLLALFAGLLFESFRVSENWRIVVFIFVGSYFFSLINFLPGKGEHIYILENHIESWPYVFILFYTLGFAIFQKDRVTVKLTEGITLLNGPNDVYDTDDLRHLGKYVQNILKWLRYQCKLPQK